MRQNLAACRAAGGEPPAPLPKEFRVPVEITRALNISRALCDGWACCEDKATKELVFFREDME